MKLSFSTFPAILRILLYHCLCGTLLVAQERVVTIENAHSGDHTYKARDTIYLKPGFSYKGENGSQFLGMIDREIALPIDYITPPSIKRYTYNTKAVGSIPGQAEVSASGAAVYQVPIEVPSGIGGVQPSVSLVYNSQSGNGIAGWGFNIGGLSAITRVPKTIYSDGYASGIKHTAGDGYALDGNRLVLTSGNCGENGAVYHTETESFSQITAYNSGRGNTVPFRFEVQTKEGTVLKYGSSSGRLSYPEGRLSSVQAWMLDYVESSNGQTIQYEYDNSQLFSYIRKITYGDNTIEFFYGERQDTIPLHYHLSKGKIDKLLRNIVIKSSGKLYRNYTLRYSKDIYSRLVEIKMSDEEGEIYNPTIFQWENMPENPEIQTVQIDVTHDSALEREIDTRNDHYFALDMDGNGITDIVRVYETKYKLYHLNFTIKFGFPDNQGNIGYDHYRTYSFPYQKESVFKMLSEYYFSPGGRLTGDVYGHGKQNIVIPYYDNLQGYPQVVFHILTERNIETLPKRLSLTAQIPVVSLADVDNNGKSDIMYMEKKQNEENKYILEILKISEDWVSIPVSLPAAPQRILHADFNADGMTDLLVLTDQGYTLLWNQGGDISECYNDEAKSTGNAFSSKDRFLETGDFNGDGLPDLLVNNTGGNWFIMQNTGNKGFVKTDYPYLANIKFPFSNEHSNCTIIDFDGDGKSDIFLGSLSQDNPPFPPYSKLSWLKSDGNDFHVIKEIKDKLHASSSPNISRYIVAGDFRGKGQQEILFYGYDYDEDLGLSSSNEKAWRYYHSGIGCNNGKITDILNGLNNRTNLDYESLVGSSIYAKTGYAAFPVLILQIPLHVVKTLAHKATYEDTTRYSYAGAQFHTQGKGFLCFYKIFATNNLQNRETVSLSKFNDSFFYPYVYEQKIYTADRQLMSSTVNEYTHKTYGGKRIFPYFNSQTVKDELSTLTVKTETTAMDDYGNPLTVKTTKGDWVETLNMEYVSRGSWCNNKLSKQTRSATLGEDTHSRIASFEYDDKGNLIKETLDPGDVNQVVTEYLNFTGHGLPTQIHTTANGITRTASTGYTFSGRFIASETDVLGETTRYVWNEPEGKLVSSQDRIGTTYYRYNRQGDIEETYFPDGTMQRNTLHWSADNGRKELYFTQTEASGQAPIYVRYNAAGQERSKMTLDWKSKSVLSINYYNDKGKFAGVSPPSPYLFTNAQETFYSYDDFGRVIEEVTPQGTTTTEYDGLTTRITSPQGTTQTTLNTAGMTESVTTNGKKVTYKYNAAGKIISAKPDGSAAITIEYDKQGNRTKLTDPDAGVISSSYDGWGQLKEVKQNIHNQSPVITSYNYLPNGLLKYEKCGNRQTDYEYDSELRIKKIAVNGEHSREFAYDHLDRIVLVTEKTGNKTFETRTAYDVLGRIAEEIYPGGYTVVYNYNQFSDLTRVWDRKGNTIWEPKELNLRGQWESVQLGYTTVNYTYHENHLPKRMWAGTGNKLDMLYDFDPMTGNLSSYKNTVKNLQENYEYDTMNRLLKWTVSSASGSNPVSWTQQYADTTGNILSKTDFGTGLTYTNKPHALVGFTPAPAALYQEEQKIEYTDFKKVKKISQGNKNLFITYGVDQQRIKSVLTNGAANTTRYYIGKYEEETTGNVTRKMNYIYGGNGLAAIYVQNSTGSDNLWFTYTDYKGSLLALAERNGTIVEEYAYDPWGKRRNPADWKTTDNRTLKVNRGYTLHEHLPEFNLINMNGRMYDPQAGLFLSPDPYVQAPGNWMNYNRYSYALNNPLIYTDPSGEFIHLIVGALTGGMSNWIMSGEGFSWKGLGYFGIGALGGGVGAGVSSLVGGALGTIGALGSGITGASSAFSGGFIVGAGNAWLGGASLSSGLSSGLSAGATGALTSGLLGAFYGGLTAYNHKGNILTGKGATFYSDINADVNKPVKLGKGMEYSNKYAKGFSDKHFPEVKGVDNLYADGTLPSRGNYETRGDYVFNMDTGKAIGGATEYNGFGKGSNVYLYKGSFTSPEMLYLNMGHEYVHATLNSMGFEGQRNVQEYSAYNWSYSQAKGFGLKSDFYKLQLQSYKAYRNRDLLNFSKKGLRIIYETPEWFLIK